MHSVAIGRYLLSGRYRNVRYKDGRHCIEKVFVANRSQCLPSLHLLFFVRIELVFL